MSKLLEVAKLAGVSKATVSRVINHSDTVSPGARDKVLEAMRALNFHMQELRRSPDGSAVLGLVMPFGKEIQGNSFGIDIMAGAEEKAFEKEYMILIGNSVGGRESVLTSNMVNRGVEGLILLSGGAGKGAFRDAEAQRDPVRPDRPKAGRDGKPSGAR
ncbi:LacI family transcriptional regulator [Paenibacillus sp. P26]|nr:LacI family transcriptional regulator [Paenibacillus sp. P26]UUZ95598.1 LacI family transcriptional regulator [Paenibacillus sp. P25]